MNDIIPAVLQGKALKQMYLNHMGTEKTRLLAHNSIYKFIINTDIEKWAKIASLALISKQHDQKIKQCHMNDQEGHGNLYELAFLTLKTSIIFVL